MALLAFLDWLNTALGWFSWIARPSIVPWVGVVAALAAALSIATKSWLKSPSLAVGRVVQVTLIWLLVAWMLSADLRNTVTNTWGGPGGGTSVPGSRKGGKETSIETKTTKRPPNKEPFASSGYPFPNDPNIVLLIRFVPLESWPSAAQDCACSLVMRTPTGGNSVQIRASDMIEFDTSLVQELRRLKTTLPQVAKPTVVIYRSPFPGEGTLRHVRQKVEAVISGIAVEFDK